MGPGAVITQCPILALTSGSYLKVGMWEDHRLTERWAQSLLQHHVALIIHLLPLRWLLPHAHRPLQTWLTGTAVLEPLILDFAIGRRPHGCFSQLDVEYPSQIPGLL